MSLMKRLFGDDATPSVSEPEDNLTKMIRANIETANQHQKIISAMKSEAEVGRWLANVFETYDVVWGVWTDPTKGVDMFPLKGDVTFRAAMSASPPVMLKVTAILCSYEQGMEARARERGS